MKPYLPTAMYRPPALNECMGCAAVTPKHALLINPFYPKDPWASFGKHVLTPSLALTSIAATMPAHWTVQYWDENLLQGHPPVDPFPEIVGITVHLTFAKRAYELADWYRRRGATIVLGGLHATSCPDEVAPYADAMVSGEGVHIWPRLIADFEADNLQKIYRGDYKRPYADDPAPRRDLLPKQGFLTTSSVIATRGCHNRCDFCYLSTEDIHMPYRMRRVEQVVAEIRDDGAHYAVFTDNNLGSRPQYLRALCQALKPLNMIWSAAVTIDVTDDPSLVRDMALAGCTGVFIGFESLSESNLIAAGKRTPAPVDYARRVRILHDNGIQVNGSFVLGFDSDHDDIFDKTTAWCEENRLECATFHILTPYPATPLFRRMEQEGRLLTRDWSRYDTAHVVFQPKHMDPETLQQGYECCYRHLFSHRSIWRRRPEDWHAVPAYFGMSYLYKRSNRLWYFLIKHRLTGRVWRPLILVTRHRHLRFRERLSRHDAGVASSVVSAGV